MYSATPFYFKMSPPVIIPSFCEPPVYTCAVTAGVRTDLCIITDKDTFGVFDSATGNYSFRTFNLIDYPEGVYTFEITAVIGPDPLFPTKTVAITFDMTLVNPCLTQKLTWSPTATFFSKTLYFLNQSIQVPYNV
jgi:hypothetical protein